MKKVLFVCLIMLLPVSAWAGMSCLTQTEMADITGRMGVSIAIVDSQQDMSIASLTWGDVNYGNRYVAGQTVSIAPGYINIGQIGIIKNTTTLNGLSTPIGIVADPLKIDVMSIPNVSASQPFVWMANRTAVVITLPDMVQTIDEISIGSISLDNAVASIGVQTVLQNGAASSTTATATFGGSHGNVSNFFAYLNSGGQYAYVNNSTAVNSHQLGQIYIRGFKQIGYSHLEGYDANGSLPVSQRPGQIIIFAHNASGEPVVTGGGGGGGGGSITVHW
jgi:hypothetical protein